MRVLRRTRCLYSLGSSCKESAICAGPSGSTAISANVMRFGPSSVAYFRSVPQRPQCCPECRPVCRCAFCALLVFAVKLQTYNNNNNNTTREPLWFLVCMWLCVRMCYYGRLILVGSHYYMCYAIIVDATKQHGDD